MQKPTDESYRLLILPDHSSPEARVCTLSHPRTSKPSRYFFDPRKGVYEFTRVAAPRPECRSWLLGRKPDLIQEEVERENVCRGDSISTLSRPNVKERPKLLSQVQETPDSTSVSKGHILKDAEILVATPIDYLFLLLPALHNSPSALSPPSKGHFLSRDDFTEKLADESKHWDHIMSNQLAQRAMEERIQEVCDSVAVGGERMYRLNEQRLLEELLRKAKSVVQNGLPASMKEKLVRRVLEMPSRVARCEESSVSGLNIAQTDTLSEAASSNLSFGTIRSENSLTSASTEVTTPDTRSEIPSDNEVYHLLCIRTALHYMISSYVPIVLATNLQSTLESTRNPIDFEPLDERLDHLANLRNEAAAQSMGNFSRKRGMYEENEAAESKAEKKRRKEEKEKKKKAGESRSIRDLKKVDTKGMKKMSDFFGKGAVTR